MDANQMMQIAMAGLNVSVSSSRNSNQHGNGLAQMNNDSDKGDDQQGKNCQRAEDCLIDGDREFDAKRFRTAVIHYSEALKFNPKSATLHAKRANCYLYISELELALSDAKKAFELDPECPQAHLNLVKLGDLNELQKLYESLDETYFKHSKNYTNFQTLKERDRKIDSLSEEKNYRECLRNVNEALQIAPFCNKLLYLQVECLIMMEKFEEAEEKIKKFSNRSPEVAFKHFFLGLMMFVQDDLESSIIEFEESLMADPTMERARQYQLKAKRINAVCKTGFTNFGTRDFHKAKAAFTDVLHIFSANTAFRKVLLYNLGRTNFELREYQLAIDNFSEALRLDEKYVKALVKRAEVHMKLKDFEDCLG